LAVALATLASVGLGGNAALLRAIAQETRRLVATILQTKSPSYLVVTSKQGKPVVVSTPALLRQATQQEGFGRRPQEYLKALLTPGSQGGLYGGGPELTVLANALRRPISIYEMVPTDPSGMDEETQNRPPPICPIECVGTFGGGIFEDPLQTKLPVPSAVLRASSEDGVIPWSRGGRVNNSVTTTFTNGPSVNQKESNMEDSSNQEQQSTTLPTSTTATTPLENRNKNSPDNLPLPSTNPVTIMGGVDAGVSSMPGAYSWHLHILVVETGYVMPNGQAEKHACVLLPHQQPSPPS